MGFIEAEGCFSSYNISNSNNNSNSYTVASFEVSQTDSYILISAIQKYLGLKTTIYTDNTGNCKLKVSSVRCIENIVNFLSKNPVELKGYKRLQYIL